MCSSITRLSAATALGSFWSESQTEKMTTFLRLPSSWMPKYPLFHPQAQK